MSSRRCAGTCLGVLARVRVWLISCVVIASCSSNTASLPDGGVAACDRVSASITASGVTARAFAGGVIQLHYGGATPASWAVVGERMDDPTAKVGTGTLCTDAMTVTIAD